MVTGLRTHSDRSLATAAAVLFSTTMFAQRGQDAAVAGTVRDELGAIIRGATVTVSSPQLIGGPRSATTDAQGSYHMSFLQPGDYEILAAFDGFTTAVRSDLALRPGLTFTVDFTLRAAPVRETVNVQGPPPMVDVRASSAPTLINRQLLDNLPLPRTPFSGAGTVADLVNLAPGVVQSVALGGTFLSNPLSLDGASGTEPGFGTPTVYPSPNWIDEVQVVSVGADAQYGEYTGARVIAITRSGSNRFSGLADYWTTRPKWTADNRKSLTPQLQARFRPIEIISRWELGLQMGGPLVKDRLWFFSGGEVYRDAYWPTTFTGVVKTPDAPVRDDSERKVIGKLTSAVFPVLRVDGYLEHATQNVEGANASPLVAPDATKIYKQPETIWNVRALWTLGSGAVVELLHGGHDFSGYFGPPESRWSGPPAHYDQLTGVTSGNADGTGDWHERPHSTSAHVNYFRATSKGSHDVRTGFEYEHASLQTFSGYVGGQLFFDIGGQASEVELWDGATYRPTQSRRTLYAQDAWSLTDRITINVGARAGFYRGAVPTHDGAFANHSLSPRVGVAWDVGGGHRTVARVHYGRYHDEFVTSFYDFLDPLSQTARIRAAVLAPNQFVEEYRSSTTARASIDPDTRFPYSEEFVAGLEQQMPWGIAARAHYIGRQFKDSIGFTDPARTWLPVQTTDPGPDGRRGTADDGGSMTVYFDQDPTRSAPLLTNPPAYRRYQGVQLMGTKRYTHNVQFQVSYTWSRTVGNYNNAAASNAANSDLGVTGVFVNPNGLINTEGRTPQDFTHDVKLFGMYRVERFGVNVSGIYRYQSGRPWARSAAGFGPQTQWNGIFVEPRGTRQLPSVNGFDLRLGKTWKPTPRSATIGAFIDTFNAWNQGVALRVTNVSGGNLGVPTQWLDPRSLRVAVRLTY